MKKSKQARTPKPKDGVDIISNLPDDLLQSILTRLQGTEEVVRTRILSRRWRYLWTSVPSIDLDYTRELDSNGFKEFVNWVLLNRSLDLDSFRLWCGKNYNMPTIRRWIHVAVMKKVKVVDLMFRPTDVSKIVELPHCVVTCGSLEVLRLCLLERRLCVPNIIGFQALRVLELNDVDLYDDDNVVKYFLESCPLLEDLSLIGCGPPEVLVISCPKLKNLRIENLKLDWCECDSLEICCPKLGFLRLTDYVAYEFLFENLYSLKKAVIHLDGMYRVKAPAFNLFSGISHVASLSISLYCIRQCFDPRVNAPISLPNLKTLEITIDVYHMDALIPFLKCVLDLESLHLIIPNFVDGLDTLDLEEAETMSILTRHLKKVEFLEFDDKKPKLDFARAILEHGKLLEEMVFSWGDEAKFHESSMKAMKRLSKFHKVSSTVKLRAIINLSQANP